MPLRLAVAAALVLAVLDAWRMRWVCDDTFITLRYIDNLLGGRGLVFNPGEHVEGYTHFLWLLLVAAAQALGADPVAATKLLGVLAYAGVLAIFWRIAARAAPERSIFFPLAALALAAHYDFRVWATGGLETAFFTLLLCLAFWVTFFTRLPRAQQLALSGLILTLAVMTRPDGILVLAVANAALVARGVATRTTAAGILRELALVDGAFIVIFTPYLAWKAHYYGDLLPNPFYAKSAGAAYWSQGFRYLWLYFGCYVSSLLFILSVPAFLKSSRAAVADSLRSRPGASLLVANAAIAAYLLGFVARTGGDFMYARFVMPIVPFVYYAVEVALAQMIGRRRRLAWAVLAALPLGVMIERSSRDHLLLERVGGKLALAPMTRTHGVVDEHHYYTDRSAFDGLMNGIEMQEKVGRWMRPYFDGLPATVILRGHNCLAYYAKFKECIETTGLTDRTIARLPLDHRGRIGHEKDAPARYLVERGADLAFREVREKRRSYRQAVFRLPDGFELVAELVTYDRELIRELGRRMGGSFVFVDFEQFLDQYVAGAMPGRSPDELRADYLEFKDYYFWSGQDPARETVFLAALGGGGP